MKLCKDCKYFRRHVAGEDCNHPNNMREIVDYIYGQPSRFSVLSKPVDLRSDIDECGPQGMWWVKRKRGD